MAPSPSAQQQRARIIRDLTQDRVRTRGTNSDAGSNLERDATSTTISSFDPEHEALNSTRQMDNSIQQALPNASGTDWDNEKKFRYLDDGYYIDLVAAGRLFGDPSESSESSMSIELGRGNGRTSKTTPNKSLPSEDPTENMVFSMGDNSLYEVTATPPAKPRSGAQLRDDPAKNSIRKDSSAKRNVVAPGVEERASSVPLDGPSPERNKSNTSKKSSSLAHMHARVTDEHDGSYLSDERPQHTATLTKNTRFGSVRNNSTPKSAIPTKFSGDNGISGRASRDGTPKRVQQNTSTNTPAAQGTGTVQSFTLPDLPNITELVSGVRADGTPLFSRMTKSRSRFTSGSNRTTSKGSQPIYVPIDSLPLPEEEKAIFASLQLLQEKVAELEIEKDQKDQRLGQYENEIVELRTQVQAQRDIRRNNSGLGTTDDEGKGPSSWKIDRAKLESSLKSLQTRLDKSESQKSISEISVKRIAQERENLVTQLGVAYMNVEELKRELESLKAQNMSLEKENGLFVKENEAFRAENQILREQLARLMGQHDEETQNWTKKEERLRSKIQKRENAVKEAREITRELLSARDETQELLTAKGQKKQSLAQSMRRATARVEKDTQTKISERIEQELRRTKSDGAAHPGLASPPKRSSGQNHPEFDTLSNTRDRNKVAAFDAGATQPTEALSEDSASDVESTTDLDMVKQRSRPRENTTNNQNQSHTQNSGRDMTLQSVSDGGDLASLRAVLEEERKALREARAIAAQRQDELEETTRSAILDGQPDTQASKRKDSLQSTARASGVGAATAPARDASNSEVKSGEAHEQNKDDTKASRPQRSSSTARANKQAQDNTVHSSTSRTSRRHRSTGLDDFEEMTSAFILPDITLHPKKPTTATPPTPTNNDNRPTLTTEAKQVLQSLAPHSPTNCTICPTLLASHAATTQAATSTACALAAFNPVPITQRQPATAAAAPAGQRGASATGLTASNDEADVTLRPTQAPRAALAAALARTQDEVAHTKAALRAAEAAYAACEPGVGRRRRMGWARRVEALVARVERRSEVVYALYDVLEGLKGDAGEGGEGEGEEGLLGGGGRALDETLQSVGIDPTAELGEAVKEAVVEGEKGRKTVGFGIRRGEGGLPDGFASDVEDEELPWEGIVTDGESVASGKTGRARRGSGF